MKDYKVKNEKSFHIVGKIFFYLGKLTKDRAVINERVKSISLTQ